MSVSTFALHTADEHEGLQDEDVAVCVLAAVLSFITYSLTGHTLNPAIIFSSLQVGDSFSILLLLVLILYASGV